MSSKDDIGLRPTEFTPMREMIEEGWLGDPDEWPPLFFRDHAIPPGRDILGFLETREQGNWLEHTSHSTVLVYMSVEDYGEEDLEFHLLSALPDIGRRERHKTWLEYEIENDSQMLWETAFDLDTWTPHGSQTPVADWAMRNGICPGQWFVVKLEPSYKTYEDYWYGGYETDFECGAALLDREKLSPEEHGKRWMEFLTDTLLEDGLPRLIERPVEGIGIASLSWACAPNHPK